MSLGVAVFVKTPSLSPIKTRLAKKTSIDFSKEFYLRSLKAIQSVLNAWKEPEATLYWAVAEKEALTKDIWNNLNTLYQGSGSLGVRLKNIENQIFKKHQSLLFLGGDCPQISTDLLQESYGFVKHENHRAVIGPARDGGFYLYACNQPITHKWTKIPYSDQQTAQVLQNHLKNDFSVLKIKSLCDVDEKPDLQRLVSYMKHMPRLTHEQKELLDWLHHCPV